jgi:hypothetical protein
MRILQLFGGIASLGLAGLLCIPAVFVAWQAVSSPRGGATPGSLPQSTHHTDFILSVGSLTLTGWHMWLFLGGLAAAGVLLAILGIYALVSRETSR